MLQAVEFSTDGFDELIRKMDALADEIGKAKTDRIWRAALSYAMEPVLQDAKSFAPKDTGDLAEHIYMKVHRPMSRDKQGKYYAGESYMARVTSSPVRSKSVLKTVLNRRGKFQSYWTNMRPVALSHEFGNAKTSITPFLRPALSYNSDRVVSRLAWSVWQAIEEVNKRKG
jgi:HK97 gp10 family phage protein